jgi:hypothetical protein
MLKTNYPLLPVEIVLAPSWWHKNEGISFDEDFFYNPARRVEVERKMEQALYERWGRFGLGSDRKVDLPVVGPVHLAAGYMLSEMLGCAVEYYDDAPPRVIPMNGPLCIERNKVFESLAFKRFGCLIEDMKRKFGFVMGDVNWGGVLNLALDVRGQTLFLDMFDSPAAVKAFLNEIAAILEIFTDGIRGQTGSTSISVNRTVRHFHRPIFLHSECSHVMLSVDDYKKFLFEFDVRWSQAFRPFGIHYCGSDPERFAECFSKLPYLDFLDVGWGGNVCEIRKWLPNTFLNIRLSPVEIIQQDRLAIRNTIRTLVEQSGDLSLTGVCCINMDEKIKDENITAIFETVHEIRSEKTGVRCFHIRQLPSGFEKVSHIQQK